MAGRGMLAVGRAMPVLARWGVSADADLVYRCLVTFGSRSADAIAVSLGLAVRRVHAALDELDDATLVRSARQRPVTGADAQIWHAVPVDVAVTTLRRRALRRAGRIDTGPGLGAPGAGPPCPARRLPDRESTRQHIADLLPLQRWADATDPRPNGGPEVVLTPREKAIVTLLAKGHTDISAAKQLGISTRSVTYALRSLMDRLRVENRFQLGLALGAMHAATPPGRSQEPHPS